MREKWIFVQIPAVFYRLTSANEPILLEQINAPWRSVVDVRFKIFLFVKIRLPGCFPVAFFRFTAGSWTMDRVAIFIDAAYLQKTLEIEFRSVKIDFGKLVTHLAGKKEILRS